MDERRRRIPWRPALRAFHRDAGYLAVGLTFVYAISGLAVNHIADWDPSFRTYRETLQLPAPLPADPKAAAAQVLKAVGETQPPEEIFPAAPDQLDIRTPTRVIHANPETGRVVVQAQKERFFLRIANWLHLNRGKKAWTLVADTYAILLLLLATTGLFMLPGKNGLRGRGGWLVAAGVLVPILYVTLAGPK